MTMASPDHSHADDSYIFICVYACMRQVEEFAYRRICMYEKRGTLPPTMTHWHTNNEIIKCSSVVIKYIVTDALLYFYSWD